MKVLISMCMVALLPSGSVYYVSFPTIYTAFVIIVFAKGTYCTTYTLLNYLKLDWYRFFSLRQTDNALMLDDMIKYILLMSCLYREYILLYIMDEINNLHLDVHTVESSTFDGIHKLTPKSKGFFGLMD